MQKIKASFGGGFPVIRRDRDEIITADEIADLLRMKKETFLKRRHLLVAAGMPRPIPGTNFTYSRPNVMAWIHSDRAPASVGVTAEDGDRNPIAAGRRSLEQRMAERAAQ